MDKQDLIGHLDDAILCNDTATIPGAANPLASCKDSPPGVQCTGTPPHPATPPPFAPFQTPPGLSASDDAEIHNAYEPPDQGLCVGNGYVIESVNTFLAVRLAATGERLAMAATGDFLGGVLLPNLTLAGMAVRPKEEGEEEPPRNSSWFLTDPR